jgi:hypothetical protein
MEDENEPPYSLLCSGCYTPCSGADAHVVPRWNPGQRRIFTTYRCGNCWVQALDETRAAVTSGDAEVVTSFCEFLARQRFTKDADTIRAAPSEEAQAILLVILDAVQDGRLIFDP